jgi:hypothetical protein
LVLLTSKTMLSPCEMHTIGLLTDGDDAMANPRPAPAPSHAA